MALFEPEKILKNYLGALEWIGGLNGIVTWCVMLEKILKNIMVLEWVSKSGE